MNRSKKKFKNFQGNCYQDVGLLWGDYVKLGFQLGLRGDQIATLVPSPSAILKGAQFTGPRHSQYDDFLSLAELVSKGKFQFVWIKSIHFHYPK